MIFWVPECTWRSHTAKFVYVLKHFLIEDNSVNEFIYKIKHEIFRAEEEVWCPLSGFLSRLLSWISGSLYRFITSSGVGAHTDCDQWIVHSSWASFNLSHFCSFYVHYLSTWKCDACKSSMFLHHGLHQICSVCMRVGLMRLSYFVLNADVK